MKAKLFVIGLFLLAFVACTSRAKDAERGRSEEGPNPELSAIDSLMWRQPDSALAVLQQFTASHKADSLDELNGHYCQLLISELLYKNDYGQSNRPALQQAVAYFDSLILTLKDTPTLKRLIAGTDPLSLTRNDNILFFTARAHYINGVGYYERDSSLLSRPLLLISFSISLTIILLSSLISYFMSESVWVLMSSR